MPGITAGAVLGYALVRVASRGFGTARIPGLVPLLASAAVLIAAAIITSLMAAARASRVDAVQAMRTG